MSFPAEFTRTRLPVTHCAGGGFCNSALPEKNGHFHRGHTGLPAGPGSECPSFYMPDQRHHMLFATLWNTGMRIGEARMLTPESFDLDGARPFVRILSEKVRARRGRPPKDEVRLVPLTDISYVRQMESWMITTRPRRREPLWAVTDETMRNWLKQAVRRAEADGVHFSIPVTPHTFRHSYIMHMLYHRQPRKVIQALAGHRDPRSMEVYTRVFALDMAATLAVPFTGDGRDAAEILRTLPP